MYSKLVYKVGNTEKTRLWGPIWMCNLGNNALVRRINALSKSTPDAFTMSKEIADGQKILSFEIPKELYQRATSSFVKILNNLNAEASQGKVLNHPDAKSIIFKLPQKDFISLKNEGNRYQYHNHKGGFLQTVVNTITYPFHNKRINRFIDNIQLRAKTPEEKAWINDYFSNIATKSKTGL